MLADITTWLQDSSAVCFIARPSRAKDTHGVLDSFWKATALRAALANRPTGRDFSRWSTRSVRSTRCGTPSTSRVTTVSVTPLPR